MNFMHMESAQKLRGGYYTPAHLAEFISEWVLEKGASDILEPSCGDGEFIAALSKTSTGRTIHIQGVEIESTEATKARRRSVAPGISVDICRAEFLEWSIEQHQLNRTFDAVVGNPPFIRYQYLPEEVQRQAEKIFFDLKLDFTKHTNVWVSFILASMRLLRAGGRMGLVIPSEILHVMHAQSLRTYLGHECSRLLIIDPEEIWFENTLQGVVILLAEKAVDQSQKRQGLGIAGVKGFDFVRRGAKSMFDSGNFINGLTIKGKWTYALLSEAELGLVERLRKHDEVREFKSVANVDVGIVTGANKFFLVNSSMVSDQNLEKWSRPMFGRSDHCPGVIYDQRQHRDNERNGLPSNFLWFNVEDEKELDRYARAYIKAGEVQGLHRRFKCRVRSPWFRVPSVYATPIGMLKRSHDLPRLILNKAKAYTTDTAYRIRLRNDLSPDKLVYCFLNSLTALSAELEGRHYGGGVLELVPSEIEKLLIPLASKVRVDLHELDRLVREKSMESILVLQDRAILRPLQLTNDETDMLRGAWSRLRHRRQRTQSDSPVSESD